MVHSFAPGVDRSAPRSALVAYAPRRPGYAYAAMPEEGEYPALDRAADGGWSVCAHDRRLVFRNGDSVVEVPVEPPLRWSMDGEDVSFEQALAVVPEELHGWLSLAALIGLRHCLAGLLTGVALPPGYQSWSHLTDRAARLDAWMEALGQLDGIDVPPIPEGVDDGLDGDLPDAGPSVAA